jgi:hypothetical protein
MAKVQRFAFQYSSDIPKFWLDAAKAVCKKMQALDLVDEAFVQYRQIWTEVERVCSQLGYDSYYWPENLMIVPVVSGGK